MKTTHGHVLVVLGEEEADSEQQETQCYYVALALLLGDAGGVVGVHPEAEGFFHAPYGLLVVLRKVYFVRPLVEGLPARVESAC